MCSLIIDDGKDIAMYAVCMYIVMYIVCMYACMHVCNCKERWDVKSPMYIFTSLGLCSPVSSLRLDIDDHALPDTIQLNKPYNSPQFIAWLCSRIPTSSPLIIDIQRRA